MCVFYQYLVKEASFRRSPLCLSDGDEFTKDKFKAASYLSLIYSMMLPDLFVFYDLMIYLLFIIVIFFPETQVYLAVL